MAQVPESFAVIAPVLRDVIAAWHREEPRITHWESTLQVLPLQGPEGWTRTVELLQLINTFQWHEEDRSRDHGADDTVLAAVKRSIDASNRRRVQTVDRLDDLLYSGLTASGVVNPAAPLNSESPGSIIDRLTVLALKVYHIAEALTALPDDDSPETVAMQERLATLTEQEKDLGNCLDNLLEGIRTGRVGLKLYRQVKVYKAAESGKLTADLD